MCVVSSLAFVLVSCIAPASPYLITSCMVVFALSFAVYYPVVFASSLEIFPEIKGTSSSATMGMRMFISSAFVAAMGYLYNGTPLTVSLVVLAAVLLGLGFTIQWLRSEQTAPQEPVLD